MIFWTLVALGLRAYRITAQSLWSDEDITLDRASLPLREMLAGLPVEQAPLYYVLMRFWTRLAGDGDLALRFPSLLAGVLAVPVAAYVGRRLAGPATALVLAALVAVNPFLVYYGQEARGYALLFFTAWTTSALAVWAGAGQGPIERAGGRPDSVGATASSREAGGARLRWGLLGVCAALCVYLHYYGALLLPVLGIWALLDLVEGRRTAFRGWLLAGLVAFLGFAPWIPRALGVLDFEGWRSSLRLAEAPQVNLSAWSAGTSVSPGLGLGMGVVFAVLALAGSLRFLRRLPVRGEGGGTALRALVLGWAPLLLYALVVLRTAEPDADGLWTADFDPRYFMAGLPGFYLLVATGLAGLMRTPSPGPRLLVAFGLVLLLALPGLRGHYFDPAFQRQDYRGWVKAVEAAAGHEDTVLFLDGPVYGLVRRYEREGSPVKIVNWKSSKNQGERSEAERRAYFDELAGEYPHLFLAETASGEGVTGEPRRWLAECCAPVYDDAYQGIRVERFKVPRAGASTRMQAEPASSGAGTEPETAARLELVQGYAPPIFVEDALIFLPEAEAGRRHPALAPGEVLVVQAEWLAAGPSAEEHRVSLRLTPAQPLSETGSGSAGSRSPGSTSPGSDLLRSGPASAPDIDVTAYTDPASSFDRPPLVDADRRPVTWTKPTRQWRAGETIVDRHALLIPEDATPGWYRVDLLLYEEGSLAEHGRWAALIQVIDPRDRE